MASYNEKLVEWSVFCTNLKPLLSDLPFLQEEHETLSSLVEEGQILAARQRIEEGALRATIRRRREVERRCRMLRDSVATILRCKLGSDGQRLAPLGLKPREWRGAARRPSAGGRPRSAA